MFVDLTTFEIIMAFLIFFLTQGMYLGEKFPNVNYIFDQISEKNFEDID